MSFKKLVEKIKSHFKYSVYSLISQILLVILFIFAIFLIPPLLNREYEFVLRVAEFAIIGSGTLAILTFTYAMAIKHTKKTTIAT
jgi:lipopolysaccharide export LptBFGC system permease protein LptF